MSRLQTFRESFSVDHQSDNYKIKHLDYGLHGYTEGTNQSKDLGASSVISNNGVPGPSAQNMFS